MVLSVDCYCLALVCIPSNSQVLSRILAANPRCPYRWWYSWVFAVLSVAGQSVGLTWLARADTNFQEQ